MDIFGLSGLDKLFCFMIVHELQLFTNYLKRKLLASKDYIKAINMFATELGEPQTLLSE